MKRNEFSILNDNKLIYFDNAATSLKPDLLVSELNKYYTNYTANIHRGDYNNSVIASDLYDLTRLKVKDFIDAKNVKEIIFTKGATEGLNMIVFGYMKYFLNENDEVILNRAEHASNILPWLELQKELNFKIVYADLEDNILTISALKKVITKNTKVISLAHVTNVLGDERDLEELSKITKEKNVLLVVDGAQSIPHKKISVTNLDIDFLVFSAHKMCGPTGVGILYGKEKLLDSMRPLQLGGGMNDYFTENEIIYSPLPEKLEAGTPNIAGVIAFGRIIDFLESIGINTIENYVKELRTYLMEKLKEVPNIEIYNKEITSTIVTFNIKGIFAQDVAMFLNRYNIAVRAGSHCAKIFEKELGVKNTCRASLYFYNTKEEVDYFIEILKKNDQILNSLI